MEISGSQRGRRCTPEELREKYRELSLLGVHNINLVTGSHYVDAIVESLIPKPDIPVVWNCSGYESIETLRKLDGHIDVYLPDYKYALREPAVKYSSAPDYPDTALAAICEMFRQRGAYEINADGIITSGVIIRHLILPDNLQTTFAVIDNIAQLFSPGEVLFSLMSQYTPVNQTVFPELNRAITADEHYAAIDYLQKSGIEDGFYQDAPTEAEADWIPEWDLL